MHSCILDFRRDIPQDEKLTIKISGAYSIENMRNINMCRENIQKKDTLFSVQINKDRIHIILIGSKHEVETSLSYLRFSY